MHPNKKTAITMVMLAAGMFALAFAAFPIYNLFCKVTGYGGTPKTGVAAPKEFGKRLVTVRFNADIAPGIAWDFRPLQQKMEVRTGENRLAFFSAENKTAGPLTGVANFNITPDAAGKYFYKIQCFCFNKQTLNAGEKVEMPVSFYIDPAIEQDPDLKNTSTLTLSYTFFKAED